jgi:hypothetical protein
VIARRARAWQVLRRLSGNMDVARARRGRWTAAAALAACAALVPRVACAHVGDEELFARFAWLLIVPLALVQLGGAVLVKRQTEQSVAGRAAIASVAAFAVALGAAVWIADPTTLLRIMRALYFVPGLPALVVLARRRMWGTALLLFLAPPLVCVALSV